MRGEGEEEGSDTFKALKTKGFTISVSSSFLFPSDSFSGEKKGIGRDFYMWGEWGKEKEKKRVYTALKMLYWLYISDIGAYLRGNLGRLV